MRAAGEHSGLLVTVLVIIYHPASAQCLILIIITNISPHNKEII